MKIVPYRFRYEENNLNNIEEVFNWLSWQTGIFELTQWKQCIFRISTSLIRWNINGYIHIKGNYENDTRMVLIDNESFSTDWSVSPNQTPLKDFFFIFNFANENYELIGDRRAEHRRWWSLYIIYEWSINLLTSMIHTVENQLNNHIHEILPLYGNDQWSPVGTLQQVIKKFEIRYQNSLSGQGTWLSIGVTPEILRLQWNNLNNTWNIMNCLEERIATLTENLEWEFTIKKIAHFLWVKREIQEVNWSYLIRNIPQQLNLSDNLNERLRQLKNHIRDTEVEDEERVLLLLDWIYNWINELNDPNE